MACPSRFEGGYTAAVWFRLLLALTTLAACSRPVAVGRTTTAEPPSPRELDARERIANRRCSGSWAYLPLVLGLGQICHNKDGEGGALAVIGSAELATGILVARHSESGLAHPGSTLPLVGYQDAWLIGVSDMLIDRDLGKGLLYAPTDTLADLVAAPFNMEVMKQPKVWGGLIAALAIGVGASLALTDSEPVSDRSRVNLFGEQVAPAVGYPAGLMAFGGLFSHVAPAEELFFRGFVQSELARNYGEMAGWAGGSLIFGAAHAPNALALPAEQRRDYLVYGLPVITTLGSYMGYLYMDAGYSLAAPTALHFWYDFLLSATFFAIDPQNSLVSASVDLKF